LRSYASDFTYHQKIIDYALDNPSLKSAQALAILALAYVSAGYTGRLWAVTSILARLATSMSLHAVDESKESKISSFKSLCLLPKTTSESEMEERRRLFWGIFILDRYVASSTGWNPILAEKDIQVRLPCVESIFQKTERTNHLRTTNEQDSWAMYVESIGIQARIIEWLRIKWGVRDLPIREKHGLALLRKVEAWWNEIPERIRNLDLTSGKVEGNIILLHITYYRYIFSLLY
jgi:Fungal specific transcription factor domain